MQLFLSYVTTATSEEDLKLRAEKASAEAGRPACRCVAAFILWLRGVVKSSGSKGLGFKVYRV